MYPKLAAYLQDSIAAITCNLLQFDSSLYYMYTKVALLIRAMDCRDTNFKLDDIKFYIIYKND